MILLVHILFGSAAGSLVKNIPIAIILAFLSHYFLDLFPHIEYPIENITKNQWRKALPEILMVFLDFCIGIFLIFILSNPPQSIIYICAIAAIIPDGLAALNRVMPTKILTLHDKFHEKIHFLKNKKISIFWRIASQASIVIISIILLKI